MNFFNEYYEIHPNQLNVTFFSKKQELGPTKFENLEKMLESMKQI
jgi:hypothetical protein